ncbi:Riboflavin synthase alpha chain [Cladochytrium tenue]|nr:Riboflavin synthase alpha chain [Cladochytrium tenue]
MVFTGIVECMGRVAAIDVSTNGTGGGSDAGPETYGYGGLVVTIDGADTVLQDVHIGDSIAVNGICLTATEFDDARTTFKVGVAPETIRKTNISDWKVGDRVNLERAMTASTRFGGHMVQSLFIIDPLLTLGLLDLQGHVDCTVTLSAKHPDPPNSVLLTLQLPPAPAASGSGGGGGGDGGDLLRFVVDKGYVCLNGVSLTVVDVDARARAFRVMLVPHTRAAVNLDALAVGSAVNLEVDEVGKYVDRAVRAALLGPAAAAAAAAGEADVAPPKWIADIVERAVDRRVDEILAAARKSA